MSLKPVIPSQAEAPRVFRSKEPKMTLDAGPAAPTQADNQRVFRPMESKLVPRNTAVSPASLFPPQQEAYARMLAGFSPNYRGNIELDRNKSADIAPHLNCSLFVMGLPPGITTHELLSCIKNCGRVYATHINPPEPDKGHRTCAAKVIFFDRESAERMYNRSRADGGFRVLGYPDRACVVWNRIRTGAQDGPRHQTRVLQISGPPEIVNERGLTAYFQTKLDFQIDSIIDRGGSAERRLIEYRFGSYRCQAEAAKMALAREMGDLHVKVWFGPDPCDVGFQDDDVISPNPLTVLDDDDPFDFSAFFQDLDLSATD
jgi:hypothetical protein